MSMTLSELQKPLPAWTPKAWLIEAGFEICSLTMEESGIFGVIVATPGLEP